MGRVGRVEHMFVPMYRPAVFPRVLCGRHGKGGGSSTGSFTHLHLRYDQPDSGITIQARVGKDPSDDRARPICSREVSPPVVVPTALDWDDQTQAQIAFRALEQTAVEDFKKRCNVAVGRDSACEAPQNHVKSELDDSKTASFLKP